MSLGEKIAALFRAAGLKFAYSTDAPPRPSESRVVTPTKTDYFFSWDGRLEPPDEVIQTFGGYDGLGFYDKVLRQFPNVYSACPQRIDRVPERRIVAGDSGDEKSVALAKLCDKLYQALEGREIIQRKLLWGMFYGFAAVEKVWDRDETTGLFAPIRLFDQPHRNIRFDEDGNAFFLSRFDRMQGDQIKPGSFMFFRWGSHWTPYGDGELKYVYVLTWMIQQIMDFGLQAIEEMGRPVPVYHIPRNMAKDERAAFERAVQAQHKFYVTVPTDEMSVRVEFPAMNVTAGGGAGRAEFDTIRYLDGWIQRALLGTQQTQDRTGGSRALEEVRERQVDDKTRQASDTLDDVWNRQWLWSDVCAFNFPDVPRELWPRFDSEAIREEDLERHHTRVMEAMEKNIPVSLEWYYKKFNVQAPKDDDDRLGRGGDEPEPES